MRSAWLRPALLCAGLPLYAPFRKGLGDFPVIGEFGSGDPNSATAAALQPGTTRAKVCKQPRPKTAWRAPPVASTERKSQISNLRPRIALPGRPVPPDRTTLS